jgi:hypothetical protein
MLLLQQYRSVMKAAFSLPTLFTALMLTVVASTPLIVKRLSSGFVFEVRLQSSAQGTVQIFYDIGKGFREEDSAQAQIAERDAPVTYRFRLPHGEYRALRFDPMNREGVVTFSNAKILDAHAKLVKHIATSQFRAVQQVSSLQIDDDSVQMITVPNANDPILAIALDAPLLLKANRRQVLLETAVTFCTIFVICCGLLWLADIFYLRHAERVPSPWRPLVASMSDHPKTAIVGTAAMAVLVSCYPVAFFGKSFVSPNNGGAPLLYDTFPTLPGYKSTSVGDVQGSDVGAIMWQHIPYSVVESRALFQDLELPLWNRYNSSGQTLLGQGLSMLGDPLHIFILLTRGASWAWDIKYLLAKLLFTVGLGLTVYTVTQHLSSSLLLVFSSAFIGFFSYRFNHPAFFSVCYAPWILFCWFRIVLAPTMHIGTLWIGVLMFTNWTVMNSGTVKEAYMLLVCLNLGGVIVFLSSLRGMLLARRKLWQLVITGAMFVLISMPSWFIFLDALRQSYTSYNIPQVWQIQPSLLIGLFDDIFYRQFNIGEHLYNPSANFFILFGCLWSLSQIKKLLSNQMYRAIGISALIPLALTFGIIPPSVIVRIPFLGNVSHVDNTFSCILLIYLIILASFGIKECWKGFPEKEWITNFTVVILVLCALLGLYFGFTHATQRSSIRFLYLSEGIPKSDFFYAYLVSLIGAVTVLPLFMRYLYLRETMLPAVLMLFISLSLLHWRHGMHLRTGFDRYVAHPQVRVNLQPQSLIVEFMRSHATQPFRAAGFGENLFPGYHGVFGIEGVYGADALENPYYRALMSAFGVERVWDWRLIVQEETLEELKSAYDFLNVKYFLASHQGKPRKLDGLQLVGRFDLDVYQSDTVWPRAFFTDTLFLYEVPSEFTNSIKTGDGQPFAAIQQSELERTPSLAVFIGDQKGHHIVPASDYRLTNNTTSFKVIAPSAGVVVLTEAYLERDFHVILNGESVPYFRVNHAFKGVIVEKPGVYTVTFSYWPQYFTMALWVSGAGLLLLCSWMYYAWRVDTKERTGLIKKPLWNY